ncbi:PREDICTED: U-box domain-containing protein 34-like isoform X2 [Lupinus angustifolius]|uniref:U-box domain-containing protein 34-like isoform X2 n=1 Tax=Lupinus angustifolius TaxID=3871 RepID=UPI00092F6077|nr:PREDICTED: U-box domain-containing protein 34-like isoform X2 [Lupinus angustifolius]
MPQWWRLTKTRIVLMHSVGQLIISITLSLLLSMSNTKTFIIVDGGTNVHPPDEEDMANVFSSLRGMCNRKAVEVKEAVIDDIDIVRGLQEYAHRNLIHSIVVGASRNPLSSFKKLKGYDVPTAMLKTAPDYSSVYVISKWKIVQARSAIRQMANAPVPPKNSFVQAIPYNESENGIRTPPHHPNGMSYDRNNNNVSRRPRSAGSNQSMDHIIEITSRSRHVSMDEKDISGLMSMNLSKQDMDLSDSSGYSPISQSTREMEAEMKRLRLELKQTMDMYSSACKQAISAKNQAEQIRQWKLKEERMVEESRLSQKAALAMAAQEKLKALAAWEEAEEARRKAEQEAQKRREAEKKAKKESEEKDRVLNALARSDNRYRRYTIEEIEAATDQFSASKKIGEGGYGPVYKGKLDHTPVAIKILSPDASQGRKQFQQEVEVLCRIRHPNMVLLLGACPEYGCLVYEHMDNGSLDDRLFRRNNSPPLSWRLRFQISAEISTALLFLHQTKPEPLVHRDLKPGNILLDRNYVSKIADVGLARLVPPSVADSVTQYYMTSAAGTFCYIDPEYQSSGMLTPKSDIYSFGIMLLQIITAKPAMGLAHQVKRAIEKDKFSEILDPAVTDWPVEKALEFAKLALECAELSKKDRPDLATVVLPTLSRLRDFGNASHRNRVLCGVDQMHSYVDYHLSSTSPNLNSKTLSTS